ncbi:MAG: hypothetical protein DRP93_05810, partial [Candidatus Neomarinimicrobiota bacterium]
MVVLADLIQRTQYSREVLLASIRKSVLWQSGIIVPDGELSRLMLAGVGSVFQFDYFLDLTDNEGRISDDSNTSASTDSIGTGTDQAIGNYRNRSWGAKNITANLSQTGDPLVAIAGRVGAYWARQMDFTMISIGNGIIASNVANDASDMVNNQTGVAIDINMILDTQQTAGDFQDYFKVMICHSAVRNKLKQDGVTDKIYDVNTGEFLYEALGGLRLVITDSVPAGTSIPGGAAGDYLSYVVGGSFLGYGEGAPKRAHEIEYEAATGNGAGQETLWERK